MKLIVAQEPCRRRNREVLLHIDPRDRRALVTPFLLVGVVATAGCADPPRALTFTTSEVPVPAGVDSAEPFLSTAADTVLMSWLDRSDDGTRELLFSRYVDGEWASPHRVTRDERLLVNVADFPSVVVGPDGALWSHWLERDSVGFGYGIRVARSDDGGLGWSEPWTPHAVTEGTEHGFVSLVPVGSDMGLAWLDGRAYAAGPDGSPATSETALYFRTADAHGPANPEEPLDLRVCDCCQTDVAVTSAGPVLVYRDRSPEEIRDIRLTRLVDGAWSDGVLVHDDGWETGACPINGPAVAASGDTVAVAWFTAAEGVARVRASFSFDGGRTFRDPSDVDDGAPAGRVDVVLLDDGSALVAWLERTGAAGADVRLRRVAPSGRRLETLSATAPFSDRATGFPRLAHADEHAILVAWTDGSELLPRVRVTRIEIEEEDS